MAGDFAAVALVKVFAHAHQHDGMGRASRNGRYASIQVNNVSGTAFVVSIPKRRHVAVAIGEPSRKVVRVPCGVSAVGGKANVKEQSVIFLDPPEQLVDRLSSVSEGVDN